MYRVARNCAGLGGWKEMKKKNSRRIRRFTPAGQRKSASITLALGYEDIL